MPDSQTGSYRPCGGDWWYLVCQDRWCVGRRTMTPPGRLTTRDNREVLAALPHRQSRYHHHRDGSFLSDYQVTFSRLYSVINRQSALSGDQHITGPDSLGNTSTINSREDGFLSDYQATHHGYNCVVKRQSALSGDQHANWPDFLGSTTKTNGMTLYNIKLATKSLSVTFLRGLS